MQPVPLLPPPTFFEPFKNLNFVDLFDGFDRRRLPMYDEHGYEPLTNGGKISMNVWNKGPIPDDARDLSVSVVWNPSVEDAANYKREFERASALRNTEVAPEFEMPGSDEVLAEFTPLKGEEGIVRLLLRYRNYVFTMVSWLHSGGHFESRGDLIPYAAAFDTHVSRIMKGYP